MVKHVTVHEEGKEKAKGGVQVQSRAEQSRAAPKLSQSKRTKTCRLPTLCVLSRSAVPNTHSTLMKGMRFLLKTHFYFLFSFLLELPSSCFRLEKRNQPKFGLRRGGAEREKMRGGGIFFFFYWSFVLFVALLRGDLLVDPATPDPVLYTRSVCGDERSLTLSNTSLVVTVVRST